MTTQDCANILNAAIGERLFDDRVIRNRVLDGQLEAVNPNKSSRQRFRITRPAFCRFVQAHHPEVFDRVKQQLGCEA